MESTIVCVTGGTGFIASHIISMLLKDGYRVRATVRSLKDKAKYQHLTNLEGASDRLEFFEANLTDSGSFDKVIDGSEYVLHTASPFALTVKDPQRDLVDPAVQGTLTVLNSCKKTTSVKRVVLTSSMAAITDSAQPGHIYTEEDWNKESSLSRNPYYYSKKLAEETGWNFIKEHEGKISWDLVVINPFLVIGPEMHPTTVNPSNEILQNLLTGKFPGIMSLGWGFVDVRDVAKAHILAMKNKNAKGRYLCCNKTLWMQVLKEKYGNNYPLPAMNLACGVGDTLVKLTSYFQPKGLGDYLRTNIGKEIKFDNSKITKELGLQFEDVHKSIYDTVDDLIAKGQIPDLRDRKSEEDKQQLAKILEEMKNPSGGVELKERKYKRKTYANSFVGSEAVDWLMNRLNLKHRASAVKIGNEILNIGGFSHVEEKHDFADEAYLYVFH